MKPKNMWQLGGLAERGNEFDVITTDASGSSTRFANERIRIHVAKGRWQLVRTLVKLLWRTRHDVAELYPGSWLDALMGLAIKARRIPLLLIARGEEYYYLAGHMPRRQRTPFRLTYRLADHVLYKETYMEELFDRWRVRSRTFLPNAVGIPERAPAPAPAEGACVILFLNTFKEFRHPETLVEAFASLAEERGWTSGSPVRLLLAGMQGERASPAVQEKEARVRALVEGGDLPIELHPWVDDAEPLLREADVFALPADVVFLNYALLEAMARGIMPIVQVTDATERVVRHEVEGLVVEPKVAAWRAALARAIDDPKLRHELGHAARERVREDYSLSAYLARYEGIYDALAGGRAG